MNIKMYIKAAIFILLFSGSADISLAAILGAKDQRVKFNDAFRKIKPEDIAKGGKYESVGIIYCWSPKLEEWRPGTAFLVKNKKGALRIISTKHVLINGDSRLNFKVKYPDTNTDCLFWLARNNKKIFQVCREATSTLTFNCAREKNLVHDISRDRNFTKPISAPPQDIYTDLAVLKFTGKNPNISNVFKLRKLKSTDDFSVDSGPYAHSFLKIPEQGLYTGRTLAPDLGVMTKASCSVYPRREGQVVVNDNIMLTDCQTVPGFSGSPLIFTSQRTGEREVRCMISVELYRSSEEKGAAFDETRSANGCQAITGEVLDLLEK